MCGGIAEAYYFLLTF